MTAFIPPEDPPPEVAEHLRTHLTDGLWHDRCPFCKRRVIRGGTGVLPEDYLPPLTIGQMQDVIAEARRALDPAPRQAEAAISMVEGEACDAREALPSPERIEWLRKGVMDVRDGAFLCDPGARQHCEHWRYAGYSCCKCRDDGDRHGREATCKW